jgi:hypothetical protein
LRIFSTQELFCNFQRFDFWNFIAWLNPNTKKIFIKVKFLPRKQKLYDLELSNRISAFFLNAILTKIMMMTCYDKNWLTSLRFWLNLDRFLHNTCQIV